MYAQLTDSYQWIHMNNNNALGDKIGNILKDGTIVSPNNLPTSFSIFRNKVKSPLYSKIVEAIEHGDIVMIYSPEIKVPIYMPFVSVRMGHSNYKQYVFLSTIVQGKYQDIANADLVMDARKMAITLEAAYISLRILQIGESSKLRSTAIVRHGGQIYSNIITSCLNRKHNIKLNEDIFNAISALSRRFYITFMLGIRNLTPDVLQSYCLYGLKNIDPLYIDRVMQQFTMDDFRNIGTFISKLPEIKEFKSRLGKLTTANFIESYINMYDSTMLFALEVFPYFLYNILGVNQGIYLNNYQVLKNIVGTEGRKIYADLVVAVG